MVIIKLTAKTEKCQKNNYITVIIMTSKREAFVSLVIMMKKMKINIQELIYRYNDKVKVKRK